MISSKEEFVRREKGQETSNCELLLLSPVPDWAVEWLTNGTPKIVPKVSLEFQIQRATPGNFMNYRECF